MQLALTTLAMRAGTESIFSPGCKLGITHKMESAVVVGACALPDLDLGSAHIPKPS